MEMKIAHIRRIETKEKKIVIGKVYYESKVYNVTYNATTGNVVICEWYNLSKEEVEEMTKFVLNLQIRLHRLWLMKHRTSLTDCLP